MNVLDHTEQTPALSNGHSPHYKELSKNDSDQEGSLLHSLPDDKVAERDDDDVQLTPQEQWLLRCKCGAFMALLPAISFAIQFLDKAVVSNTSVMGIRKDLNMHGDMYSWTASSFFIGYLVCNLPFALLLLEKAGPRWTGAALFAWGIVVTCSGGAQNYAGFIACRTLLGMLESVCEPTITIVTHQWMPPDEHYAWIETWFAWNGFMGIFLHAISYGLYRGQVHGKYNIAAWRILFIICGLISILAAFVYILIVPNSPQEAWFLNDREKAELRKKDVGEKKKFKRSDIEWHQIREALTTDLHKTACLFVALFCTSLESGAINTFTSLIIKEFIVEGDRKLTNVEANERSLLYGMIPAGIKAGGCSLIAILCLNGVMKSYRCFYVLLFSALHVTSAFMLVYGSHNSGDHGKSGANVSLAGTYMYSFCVQVVHGGVISLCASNCQGRTKKIFVNGLTLLAFALGNIIGPKAVFKGLKVDGLKWSASERALGALASISFASLIILFITYFLENRQRDKKNENLPEGARPELLTDRENPEFRYHL